MTFWIVAGVLSVALLGIYWWASRRSPDIDPSRDRAQSEAYLHSHEHQQRFDAGGPFG